MCMFRLNAETVTAKTWRSGNTRLVAWPEMGKETASHDMLEKPFWDWRGADLGWQAKRVWQWKGYCLTFSHHVVHFSSAGRLELWQLCSVSVRAFKQWTDKTVKNLSVMSLTTTGKQRSQRGEGGDTEIKTVAAYLLLDPGNKPTKPVNFWFFFLIYLNIDTSVAPVHNKLAPKTASVC